MCTMHVILHIISGKLSSPSSQIQDKSNLMRRTKKSYATVDDEDRIDAGKVSPGKLELV